ncbi:Uncharacterised protein [uncultured archaeon]|nr:Uncharacterised protein [uncultured archaeon]
MKKLVTLVLALVVIAAVAALYILIKSEGISGKTITCDPYETRGCYYDQFANSGCCFTVTNSEGSTYDECYLSYRFALSAYQEAQKDSQKVKGGLTWVGGLRTGPYCTH